MDKLASTLIFVATAVFLACTPSAWAGTENDAVFELQVTGCAGHGDGRSLLAMQLYAEKSLPIRDVAAFLVVHNDQGFRAYYAGFVRKFDNLQLGIGFGNAWYDQIRHPAVNPWLFYAGDDVEAFLSVERYARDDHAPWFFKGHASRRMLDSFFVGAYGKTDMGAGPMIGWRNASFRIWVAVPVVSRPEAGAQGVAGVQVEF